MIAYGSIISIIEKMHEWALQTVPIGIISSLGVPQSVSVDGADDEEDDEERQKNVDNEALGEDINISDEC